MTSASSDLQDSQAEVDVWLEVGREGMCFTYVDSHPYSVDLGDLVRVKLRGKPMHGLVVAKRDHGGSVLEKQKKIKQPGKFTFSPVDGVLQRAAVNSEWRKWLEEMAFEYHTSTFRMLKTALPPGWLGQSKIKSNSEKSLWWVEVKRNQIDSKSFSKRELELREFLISKSGGTWQKDLLMNGFAISIIKRLISKGLISRSKRLFSSESKIYPKIEDIPLPAIGEARDLTYEQNNAIRVFEKQPPGSSLLLWGVTGSGKTEVYLQMVEKEIAAGRSSLVLAPEIGLIPQLVDRFKDRFGARVFEYHSGCSQKERVRTWRLTSNSSSPCVVVGTRSSVFLPLSSLGLIVLDEEHDSSYKQDSPMPCYHARDLAISRALRTGARVVLGSATPSLNTWKNLAPNGQILLARLTRRISNNSLPRVFVVDMRNELAEGHRSLISRPLMDRISELPQRGEQAVLLVPRRGYSTFISCRSCGEVVQCPNCDLALTVHRSSNGSKWLRCHWCDHRSEVNSSCSECGSKAFKPFGAGTQKVIDLLANELQGVRFLRFDRDTTGGRDGHRELLEKFAEGKADVLIGTQMLAKGMDLPRVTLAAVLAADGLLHRPDLLATEQSLQLFMQLAGRAGRGELPGEVLVQTYCPDHPVILHLLDGSYEAFLKKESKIRKDAGLVPYRRACLLRFAGESASLTANAAGVISKKIRPYSEKKGWSLLGPAPALVARVAGKSRWQILLHGPEQSPLPLPFGNELWDALPKGVTLSIDQDPLQL